MSLAVLGVSECDQNITQHGGDGGSISTQMNVVVMIINAFYEGIQLSSSPKGEKHQFSKYILIYTSFKFDVAY